MSVIELSAITGPLAKMGADKAFTSLRRSEAAIKARRQLKLPSAPKADDDFLTFYRHALVEWGMFKPEPVLDFFRDETIYRAFERSFRTGDLSHLERDAEEVVRRAEEAGAFRRLEYDPRRELDAFTLTFNLVVTAAQSMGDARRDVALAQMGRQLDDILDLLRRRTVTQARDAAIGGDVHFSGEFNNVIINLLSNIINSKQSIGDYTPPPPPDPGTLPDPGHLPPGHRMPFARNALFTGRETELRELASSLLPLAHEARSELVTPRSSLVTSGIGGVGKTQLAIEFAHRYGRFFHGVHWVSLENPDAVAAEIAQCGAAMGLRPDFDALPAEVQTRQTLAAWCGPEPRLVIFDNCEEPALLAQWRPSSGGAALLVTSRNTRWPPELGVAARRVAPLPRAQSVALLREYVGATDDGRPATAADAATPAAVGGQRSAVDLDRVAAEVGDLPLALALAGHYLARYRRVAVDGYLAELRRAEALVPVARGAARPTGHDLSVWNTFAVSFDRLDPADETDAAARALLARAACFAPGELLPEGLLLGTMERESGGEGEKGGKGEGEKGSEWDSLLIADGLYRLLELGLLERAGDEACRLHRLVARFAAGATPPEEMDAARAAVEGAIISLAYKQNVAGYPRALRDWEIHLRHVTDGALDREDESAATLCTNLGFYLQMSGDLPAARPYFERALAIYERVLGPDHPDTASSLNNMGMLLQAMGDLPGARPYLERALAVRERVLGPDHPDTARSLNNMGVLLQAMGDLPAARPYYERALAIRERVLGPDHPDTATSLNDLSNLLQAQGNYAEAKQHKERVLAIYEKALGENHPWTATSLNNLGAMLQAMGDLPAARPYYERALAIRERVLGPDHPDTSGSLNNMGGLLQAMGDLPAARPYYERALAIRERVLGPEHPDTAGSLNNMGFLLQAMGDLPAARPYYERALAIDEKALGTEHPLTAIDYSNLGVLCYYEGNLPDATDYMRRALAAREKSLGPNHPDTISSRKNLATIEAAMRRS